MRLIDADKLNVDYVKASTATNTMLRYISEEQVENAPIVDAIPVEWIKKYIVDNTQSIDEVAGLTVNYYIYPQQIATMLKAWWEKENERNV